MYPACNIGGLVGTSASTCPPIEDDAMSMKSKGYPGFHVVKPGFLRQPRPRPAGPLGSLPLLTLFLAAHSDLNNLMFSL